MPHYMRRNQLISLDRVKLKASSIHIVVGASVIDEIAITHSPKRMVEARELYNKFGFKPVALIEYSLGCDCDYVLELNG